MPAIVHAVQNQATMGEIGHTLRRVFGRHEEVLVV
jgi:methylmalonyl-CoA mutase N-terminal domain/subunit